MYRFPVMRPPPRFFSLARAPMCPLVPMLHLVLLHPPQQKAQRHSFLIRPLL